MSTAEGSEGVPAAVGKRLIATIVLLCAVAPLATDMYVPGFPHVERELQASAATVSLTLTTFFGGMGLGQLFGGLVSDKVGRRVPLMAGTVLTLLASVGCALAPSIPVLLAARFLQGLGGGWAAVIARAVIVDLTHGPALVRIMNLVMAVGAVAPIVAPLGGAVILQLASWRMAFWVLAVLAALMLATAAAFIPESLPPERRHGGGLAGFVSAARDVLSHRRFVGYMLVNAMSGLGLFSYVSTSPFILQTMHGLSPALYAADFATNAGGMMIATLVSSKLAGRVPTRRVILTGQCIGVTAGASMLVGTLFFGAPLPVFLAGFFGILVAQGLIFANGGALASAEVKHLAGTGAAVLGLVQSAAAAIAPPLAGLGGSSSAVSATALMLAGQLLSMAALLFIARPARANG